MDWMEVVVHTTTAGADIVSEVLMNAGATGTAIEDRADVPQGGLREEGFWELVDDDLIEQMSEDVLVKAYFEEGVGTLEIIAALKARLAAMRATDIGIDMGSLELQCKTVNEASWKDVWKKYYKPFRVGARLVIKPSWEEYDAAPEDLVIELDPGMAFGTGTHETTFMCMEMLQDYVKPGMTCIDLGTGTGILAIAAAKLGARDVLAIDLDENAVKVAKDNIKNNALSDTVRAEAGNLFEKTQECSDIVVANIIADVICGVASGARAHIQPGGVFICSGIIKEREQDVLTALTAAGYTVAKRLEKGEWVCLAARP